MIGFIISLSYQTFECMIHYIYNLIKQLQYSRRDRLSCGLSPFDERQTDRQTDFYLTFEANNLFISFINSPLPIMYVRTGNVSLCKYVNIKYLYVVLIHLPAFSRQFCLHTVTIIFQQLFVPKL